MLLGAAGTAGSRLRRRLAQCERRVQGLVAPRVQRSFIPCSAGTLKGWTEVLELMAEAAELVSAAVEEKRERAELPALSLALVLPACM